MMYVSRFRYNQQYVSVIAGCIFILIIAGRFFVPERSVYDLGFRAVLDSAFVIFLLGIVLLLACGVGLKIMSWVGLRELPKLELVLFSAAVGFGTIAYTIFALGLLGFINYWALSLMLLGLCVAARKEIFETTSIAAKAISKSRVSWIELAFWKKLVFILICLILLLCLTYTLTPPTDPDGLIHHLQVAKIYLEAQRIYPLPDFPFGNYPMTFESLFILGMVYGSDTFAKLIHLSFGSILMLATFAFGKRFIGSSGGWIAAAILIGMPIFPIWASLAYIDMGWALYEFLGVYAVILWVTKNQKSWLLLSGVFIGLALGSKYLAVGGAIVVGLWILWQSRNLGWRDALITWLLFGGTALLVASPWYLKNWIWFNNPVFPFFEEGSVQSGTISKFGFWDYVILPWHLYFNREAFVGVFGTVEFPSLLFPLAFLYPLSRRSKALDSLAILVLLRYIFWAIVIHGKFRYLLPVLPGLSLISTNVILSLYENRLLNRWIRVIIPGLIGGLLVITLVYMALFFVDIRPSGVILGYESKDNFLRRELGDYKAIQFIKSNLSKDSRVLFMWDPRGYYCDERCLPDLYLRQWVEIATPGSSLNSVVKKLRSMDVTHLLFDVESADYRIKNDLEGDQYNALVFYKNEFSPSCTEEVFRTDLVHLLELTCR